MFPEIRNASARCSASPPPLPNPLCLLKSQEQNTTSSCQGRFPSSAGVWAHPWIETWSRLTPSLELPPPDASLTKHKRIVQEHFPSYGNRNKNPVKVMLVPCRLLVNDSNGDSLLICNMDSREYVEEGIPCWYGLTGDSPLTTWWFNWYYVMLFYVILYHVLLCNIRLCCVVPYTKLQTYKDAQRQYAYKETHKDIETHKDTETHRDTKQTEKRGYIKKRTKTQRHTETHTTQQDTEWHWQPNSHTGTDRHTHQRKQTQTEIDKRKQTQTDTDRHTANKDIHWHSNALPVLNFTGFCPTGSDFFAKWREVLLHYTFVICKRSVLGGGFEGGGESGPHLHPRIAQNSSGRREARGSALARAERNVSFAERYNLL